MTDVPTEGGAAPPDTDYLNMMRSIGQCLMAWASVEFQLGDMFRMFHGGEAIVSTEVWDSIVSFDARTTMLQRILKHRFPNGDINSDMVLLFNETRRRYKQRNEVAHSTLLKVDEQTYAVEPFFVIGHEKPKLYLPEIVDREREFMRLAGALSWLHTAMDPPPSWTLPPQSYEPPLHDLVLGLRAADFRAGR